MEDFGAVKSEGARHHPEDVSSDESSDTESKNSFDLDAIDISDDEYFEIPRPGDNDTKKMPMYTGSSSTIGAGSYNTVRSFITPSQDIKVLTTFHRV